MKKAIMMTKMTMVFRPICSLRSLATQSILNTSLENNAQNIQKIEQIQQIQQLEQQMHQLPPDVRAMLEHTGALQQQQQQQQQHLPALIRKIIEWSEPAVNHATHIIAALHEASGMPYWITMIGVALALRSAMMPLTAVQVSAAFNQSHTFVGMHILMNSLQKSRRNTIQKLIYYSRAAREIRAMYGAQLWKRGITLVPQLPIFVVVGMAARRLAYAPEFAEQGAFWFQNLGEPDPYYALPIACVVLSCYNIGIGKRQTGKKPAEKIATTTTANSVSGVDAASGATNTMAATTGSSTTIRAEDIQSSLGQQLYQKILEGAQIALIASLPMLSTLPAGFFIFWLTSSVWSTIQSSIMQRWIIKRIKTGKFKAFRPYRNMQGEDLRRWKRTVDLANELLGPPPAAEANLARTGTAEMIPQVNISSRKAKHRT